MSEPSGPIFEADSAAMLAACIGGKVCQIFEVIELRTSWALGPAPARPSLILDLVKESSLKF